MIISPLALPARAAGGYTHKITLTFADLTAAASSQAFSVLRLKAVTSGALFRNRVAIRVRQAFAGTFTALTATLTDNASNTYINALALQTSPVAGKEFNQFTGTDSTDYIYTLTVNAGSGNVNAGTAGIVDIYIGVYDMRKAFR